jgi:hypothetical protein
MPLDRRVRCLKVSWEDLVGLDKLSEEWRSCRDVASIDGSDSDDPEGSLPPLLNGLDLGEQDLGDGQLGLDAAGLIHYLDDIVVYGGIPFGSVLSPLEFLRRREEYEVLWNWEALGLCRVVHPQVASVIYRGSLDYSWLVPHCLALSILEVLACPTCGLCWWGPEGVTVYSSTGLAVRETNGDSAGVTDWSATQNPCAELRVASDWFFTPSSLQHLFGRGHHTTYLILDMNGLTFHLGSCRCSVVALQD